MFVQMRPERRAATGLLCAALLGTLAGAPACSSIPHTGPVTAAPGAGDWRTVLAEHSRQAESFDWLVRQADLRATLVTPRLRKAFLDARASFHGQLARELEVELVGMGAPDEGADAPMRTAPASEGEIVLLVALYVTDQKNRDISASYTIWDTELVIGDQRIRPTKMETLRNAPAAAEVFPFIDRFDDLYLLRFPGPLPAAGGPIRLELRSALADPTVEWQLAP
ncbi:MAG: hypothetical protein A2138_06265 [Deltaproteobacteria bacterium RBG_16_71_12]|nr:MAG: hypothetical protein A2138_06265 [Deltaproteobacteria bacterium RBG_16_71_12]